MGFRTDNQHVLGYLRFGSRHKLLCLCNFHDEAQTVHPDKFAAITHTAVDLVSGQKYELKISGLPLRPLQYMWLRFK